MKNVFRGKLIMLSVFILMFSCQNSSNSSKQNLEEPKSIIEGLYDFAETTDKEFCNVDSIIGTDCGGGFLYFTEKGNVICNFLCMGQDSTIYDIGTYSFTEESVNCTFNQSYSFYNGSQDDESQYIVKPNEGSFVTYKKWTIRLKRINCKGFDYYFKSNNETFFVLNKATSEKQSYFFDDFKKIEQLSKL